jgi:hypothetical protein
VFTARYALSPYIKHTHFGFKKGNITAADTAFHIYQFCIKTQRHTYSTCIEIETEEITCGWILGKQIVRAENTSRSCQMVLAKYSVRFRTGECELVT